MVFLLHEAKSVFVTWFSLFILVIVIAVYFGSRGKVHA